VFACWFIAKQPKLFSAILEHEWVASHPEIQKQAKTAWLIQ